MKFFSTVTMMDRFTRWPKAARTENISTDFLRCMDPSISHQRPKVAFRTSDVQGIHEAGWMQEDLNYGIPLRLEWDIGALAQVAQNNDNMTR